MTASGGKRNLAPYARMQGELANRTFSIWVAVQFLRPSEWEKAPKRKPTCHKIDLDSFEKDVYHKRNLASIHTACKIVIEFKFCKTKNESISNSVSIR